MYAYDEGHELTIANKQAKSINIYASTQGDSLIDDDTTKTVENFFSNDSSAYASLSLAASETATFVYANTLSYEFQVGTKIGCWIKI